MSLNYKEYGKGTPIIILHGLLGMLDNWHSFAKKLSEEYWIISIDQRNHGKSFHDSNFDYDLLSQDLYYFLEEQHIPRCHILGHSLGGKTALNFIRDYPDMVDKTIIVDISPKAYKGSHHQIFEAMRSLDLSKLNSRKEAQDYMQDKLDNNSVVLFLMKNLARNPEGTYRWKANIDALFDNYSNIVQSIDLEEASDKDVLFIRGEKSSYVSDKDIEDIKENYPYASFKTINNAGHWVHVDNSEDLLSTVKEYLH